ncbi:spinster family MFS transporter [Luteimonas kalidii]|uniref:MFS transporter n=1 Tax=Luteimonas kalidii TaxID=3042025 RepID=A0ABT6JVC9_9GAMM|nr:MFS transporter [Luteimonas kalidii]MDH5834622.1 MFS transporter [Luteimonas kalidii]
MAGAPAAAAIPGAQAARAGARAWIVLAVLCFVYVLNFLDRQLLSILAKPIQDELGVSDSQLGLIGGLYFAMFYCILAIPVGWLADRTNRVRVLAFSCGLWSAATAACGMASSYPQLALARMTVGIGEAGGVPPSYAIISDYFPPGTRGTALGLFNLGPPIGAALGVAFGASVAAAYSWRMAFIWVGVVGVITAAGVWYFIREPRKGGLDAAPEPLSAGRAPVASPGFSETCRGFFANPVLRYMALACGATQFVTYAMLNFTVLMLMREKGMTLEEVAVWYALVFGLGSALGMFLSGRLIDRLARRSRTAYAYLPATGLVLAIPFFIAFVAAGRWELALVFLFLPTGLNYFYLSPAVTLVQEEVRPDQRVLSGALLLLVMNLIGLGFGPTYLGMASDFFRASHPHNSLQMAFYTLVPFYLLAIGLFLLLARSIRRQLAQETTP